MKHWLWLWLLVAPMVRAQLPDTLERVKPAVVAVGTYLPTRTPAFRFTGTGFAVGDGSLVATNAHVLAVALDEGSLERWAIALPGASSKTQVRVVSVAARDAAHDLVLLRQTGSPLPTLLMSQEPVREGEEYSFTGYPIGAVLGLFPVTHRALVSALSPIALPQSSTRTLGGREIRALDKKPWRVIQLDATAYPGNSGSPLYHPESGEVVGIINMVLVKGSRESAISQPSGITFAIPVEYLESLVEAVLPPRARRSAAP